MNMGPYIAGFLVILVFGSAQLWAGFIGIQDGMGTWWAWGAIFIAFMFRFTLPVTIGSFFGAMNVWGWHWALAAIFAVPGLALVIPSVLTATTSLIKNIISNLLIQPAKAGVGSATKNGIWIVIASVILLICVNLYNAPRTNGPALPSKDRQVLSEHLPSPSPKPRPKPLPKPAPLTKSEQEAMADSVRSAFSIDPKVEPSIASPTFENDSARIEYLLWLGAASERLKPLMKDPRMRLEFLEAVWYESRRAGLDTSIVLAHIEVASAFRQRAVSASGGRGYMSISPTWLDLLGQGEAEQLFYTKTNLRLGCVILRTYLDRAKGDIFIALTNFSDESFSNAVFQTRSKWVFNPSK